MGGINVWVLEIEVSEELRVLVIRVKFLKTEVKAIFIFQL